MNWLTLGVCLLLAAFPARSAYAQQHKPTGTVRVLASDDLQPALPAILDVWEKQTGEKAVVSYASSAQMARQTANGAAFDLLLAADMQLPQQLADKGLAGKPVAYARGTLVLWARNDSPVQPLSVSGLAATLTGARLNKLAIPNPAQEIYGKAAEEFLSSQKLTDAVKPKLTPASDIAQTAQFAASGKAQAALLPLTYALTAQFRSEGKFVPVPNDMYPAQIQGAAVLTASTHQKDAQRLLNFLTGPTGVALLRVSGLSEAPKALPATGTQ